jgi:hypothetical protein
MTWPLSKLWCLHTETRFTYIPGANIFQVLININEKIFYLTCVAFQVGMIGIFIWDQQLGKKQSKKDWF